MTAVTITTNPSPFIFTGPTAKPNDLAILHLKRDLLVPTILRSHDESNEGYFEGKVSNTRFGSFPHSTLIGLSWGSQVRASAVDTGSRGRKNSDKGKKRKRGFEGKDDDDAEMKGTGYGSNSKIEKSPMLPKAAVRASTGFVHLLPPTPETWTAALPHRTQVVYTPDYSYILHRIRARPGSVLIEAGAGSGSFTHAAARAVFNGYTDLVQSKNKTKLGKIWSYEFHEQRFQKLKIEINEHRLDEIVEITQKDVCQDGFGVEESRASLGVNANAIFLDLPAPWLALKHLVRNLDSFSTQLNQSATASPQLNDATSSNPLLDPGSSIYLCTFSPCIEQVQRTISTLRKLGWHDIETVETSSKRFETKRERIGLQEEGIRGSNGSPASVDEALARLREVEGHSKIFHQGDESSALSALPISKQDRLRSIQEAQEGRKLYKAGRLVHRAEQELKMHTSYLVFAILPREWSLEDELAAQQSLPAKTAGGTGKEGTAGVRFQAKRAAKSKAGGDKAFEMQDEKPGQSPD